MPIPHPTPSPRIRRIRRIAIALLVLGGVINYIDRATLAVGLPQIQAELGFSLKQSGVLLSAFLWSYALCQIPAGGLVDRFGARLMMALGLGLWSLAQLAAGFVGSLWQFAGVRVLLGAGESPQFPTCTRVVSDWYAKRERGRPTGIWNCSSTLGTAISVPLLTWLMLGVGWRWMFGIMGLLGIVVAAGAYLIHRNPQEVGLNGAEREYLTDDAGDAQRISWEDWKSLLKLRNTWGMVCGFFGTVYLSWIYQNWLPRYLELEWHFSIKRTGWVGAIPFAFGVLGSIFGGWLCDFFVRRGHSPIMSRKIPFMIGLTGAAACTALAAMASAGWVAVCFISGTLFLLYVSSCAVWAMATVATSRRCSASLGALQNCGGYIGGAISPIVTSWIAQEAGSFRPALMTGAGVALCAVLVNFVLVREPAK